ncbi:MAG: hypothetical protein ACOX25_07405 [Caldicoprobacterales bacterium]|jgi:hypothetical protein|nr:hypothetical protein [Clostridiales bacterium]
MVHFRRMRLSDLDRIYRDPEIRPLITTSYKGNSFAVIIEQEGDIIGGVSGYAVDNAAFVLTMVLKEVGEYSAYIDGLIRSLIHFLELDGLDLLLIKGDGDESLYSSIGFHKLHGTEKFLDKQKEQIQEAFQEGTIYWIDLRKFFAKHQK